MDEIISNAMRMVECGELRVIFRSLPVTMEGHVMSNNGMTTIVLNSSLSYDMNIKKFLHEIRHLYHLNTSKTVIECENESEEFENNPIALQKLFGITG